MRATEACQTYGYHPGTDAYAGCMERAAAANQAWWSSLGQTLIEAQGRYQQSRPPPRQPTSCTTSVVGNYLNTYCY